MAGRPGTKLHENGSPPLRKKDLLKKKYLTHKQARKKMKKKKITPTYIKEGRKKWRKRTSKDNPTSKKVKY